MWASIDQAITQATGALQNPQNTVDALAIYLCPRCSRFHQSRQLDGDNVVRIVRRS